MGSLERTDTVQTRRPDMRTLATLLGLAAAVHGANIPAYFGNMPGGGIGSQIDDNWWGYDGMVNPTSGITPILPAAWGTDVTLFTPPACAGSTTTTSQQSPIDIVTANVVAAPTVGDLMISSVFNTTMTGVLSNTGRALTWEIDQTTRPTLMGGPFAAQKVYVFNHASFHFGSVATQGSEHTMDGTKYPMEMQLHFYDSQFKDEEAAEASTNADALAVVSVFFQTSTSTSDNPDLATFVTALPNIAAPTISTGRKKRAVTRPNTNTDTTFQTPLTLNLFDFTGLTSLNINEFYYYDGSTTVPGCREIVKWIITKQMVDISTVQLTALRTLQDAATTPNLLNDNFRPVQTLATTTNVMYKAPTLSLQATQVGTILGAALTGIGTFGAVYNLLSQEQTAKALRENPVVDFINDFGENIFGEDEEAAARGDEHAHHHEEHHVHHEHQEYHQQEYQQPQQFQTYLEN